MASHCLQYLYETCGKYASGQLTDETLFNWKDPLSFAQLGDNFNTLDWDKLVMDSPNVEQFMDAICEMLPHYRNRWKEIGCPKTAEEWQERKYWAKGRTK